MSNRVTTVQNIARIGFLARGVVYILLGYFAFATNGGSNNGTAGVMQQLGDAGTGLLALVGLGLAAYGFFRLYTAILNLEPEGAGWKGKARRIGHAASGLGHFVLAYTAYQIAFGTGSGGGESSQQEAATTVLNLPLGSFLLAIVAIGFLAASVEQATKAITAKFMHLLAMGTPAWARTVGRIGYAARAVVFFIIGFALGKAAFSEQASEVKGIGGALTTLTDMGWLYTLTAIGLIAFGIFSLVMARYRTIRDEDVIARLKSIG